MSLVWRTKAAPSWNIQLLYELVGSFSWYLFDAWRRCRYTPRRALERTKSWYWDEHLLRRILLGVYPYLPQRWTKRRQLPRKGPETFWYKIAIVFMLRRRKTQLFESHDEKTIGSVLFSSTGAIQSSSYIILKLLMRLLNYCNQVRSLLFSTEKWGTWCFPR